MLAIAGVATAAVVLFAVPLAVVLQRSYRDEALLRLQRDTVAATRQIDVTGGGDPVELPKTGDTVSVYDAEGRRLAGPGPVRARPAVRAVLQSGRLATETAENRLVAVVPLLSDEKVSGAVQAVRSDSTVEGRERAARLALAGLAFGVIAASVLAATLLGRRLAQPLERLAATARKLGEGNFAVRAPRAGVAEVDSVAAALDATAKRLGDLVVRERSFSADASHQLRTPLAALRLELEAMELRGAGSQELSAALAQVERLNATIDTLLAVARDAPRGDAEVDLTRQLDEAEGRWRGAFARENRPLRIAVLAERTVAAASPQVVAEVLEVLLANARNHGAGAVTLTAREVEGWLAVDVADEGEGFDGIGEDPFARRSSPGEGFGIGLSLARSLAVAEGGALTVLRAGPGPVVRLMLRRSGVEVQPAG